MDTLRERAHNIAPVMGGTDPSTSIDAGCLIPCQGCLREDVVERMSETKATGHRRPVGPPGRGTANGQCAVHGLCVG